MSNTHTPPGSITHTLFQNHISAGRRIAIVQANKTLDDIHKSDWEAMYAMLSFALLKYAQMH